MRASDFNIGRCSIAGNNEQRAEAKRFRVSGIMTQVVATGLCASAILRVAPAQQITFVSRGGADTVYCGIPGAGPLVQHNFSTFDPTDDTVSVSDPGAPAWPPSSASASLQTTPSLSGLSIVVSGNAMRGAPRTNGVYATADARDSWQFAVTNPMRFTFYASLAVSSSESTAPVQGYTLGISSSGQIVPDPGTPTDAFNNSFSVPGSLERRASGIIKPGQYFLSLTCRTEGTASPFTGAFNGSVALSLTTNTLVITRIQALPQGLQLQWSDTTLRQYTVETKNSLVGGAWMPVSGVAWPVQTQSVLLPLPATSPAFFRVRAQ
jgi:hypothetical protein